MKISRSKAPLRLGLAGGGTDLQSYSSIFGGEVLNVTINLYAHCTVEEYNNGYLFFEASDLNIFEEISVDDFDSVKRDSLLQLHCGVYSRICKDFLNGVRPSLKISTYADSPIGSGLGTSSSLVVAIIKSFVELYQLPLGEYDIAKLAYDIERNDLNLSGGKQDQYAATFGGFNYIEFKGPDDVIVNPLRIKKWIKNELEESMVLFFTGKSRDSSLIIDQQIKETTEKNKQNLDSMHDLKIIAQQMKKSLLVGDIKGIISHIESGWEAKKKTSSYISNPHLDHIYQYAKMNGALAGKISGAGGGGFFIFFVMPTSRQRLITALNKIEGKVQTFQFTDDGTTGWYF